MKNYKSYLNESYLDDMDIFKITRGNDFRAMKRYINGGGNINVIDNKYGSLISCASIFNSVKILRLLIKAGIDLNRVNRLGNSVVISNVNRFYKRSINDDLSILKMLIDGNADLDIQNKNDNTALMFAASNHKIEIIKILIDGGADWNLQNVGRTFIDLLENTEVNELAQLYPEKYQEYLKIKKREDFNL